MSEDMAAQSHYTVRNPEAIEVIQAWNLDYLEGNVLKYLARWRYKGGVADLEKASVYLQWLIEREKR